MMKQYRMLAFVPRWGIAPRHHPQSVAEHSFFVVLYASEICHMLDIAAVYRGEVMDAALRHDAFEAWTSDPPGPAKRSITDPVKYNAYHKLFADGMGYLYRRSQDFLTTGVVRTVAIAGDARLFSVKAIVKVADLIDEVFYLAFEQNLGNNMVRDLYQRELSRLDQAAIALAGDKFAEDLMGVVGAQIARIGEEGAQIPSNDTDLKPAEEPPLVFHTKDITKEDLEKVYPPQSETYEA